MNMAELLVRCLLGALAGGAISLVLITVAGWPLVVVAPISLVVGICIGLM